VPDVEGDWAAAMLPEKRAATITKRFMEDLGLISAERRAQR
jgi:hypothetical protein